MKLENIALAAWLALAGCSATPEVAPDKKNSKEIIILIDQDPNSLLTDEVTLDNGVIDRTHAKLKNGYTISWLDDNKFYLSSPPLQDGKGIQIYLECNDSGRVIELTLEEGTAKYERTNYGLSIHELEPSRVLVYRLDKTGNYLKVDMGIFTEGWIATEHPNIKKYERVLINGFERLTDESRKRFEKLREME